MRVAASLLLLAVILPALAGAAWSACLRSGIRRVRRAHRGGLAAALDIFTTSEWNPAISKPFHIRPGRRRARGDSQRRILRVDGGQLGQQLCRLPGIPRHLQVADKGQAYGAVGRILFELLAQ
ncbi:hypothetical protein D9M68_666530 [compost metagenome]